MLISLWKFYRGVKLWNVHRPAIAMQNGLARISASIRGLSKPVQIRRPVTLAGYLNGSNWKVRAQSHFSLIAFFLLSVAVADCFYFN